MKANRIHIEKDRVAIESEKAPLFILTMFMGIALISFLMPITVTLVVLLSGESLKFGLIITFLIFWAISAYMLRIWLWNLYGREIFYLQSDAITYYSDFRFFTDGKKTLLADNLIVETENTGDGENTLTILLVSVPSEKIQTTLKISKADGERIKDHFKMRYNNVRAVSHSPSPG